MSTATLSGRRVTRARVSLPAWGIPWADVALDEEATLTGRVALAVADLTLSGTIMSGGPGPVGRSSFRVAAGAGAWGRTIPAKNYHNDNGVKTATVLADAATACGETIDPATLPGIEVKVGPAWTRDEGPASRVLELLAPSAWYVGTDGITRIGKRAARPLATPATVGSVDRARRIVSIAAEQIAELVPGVVVVGIEAVDVLHEVTPGALRSTLWGAGAASTSRALTAFRRLLEQLDPDRAFRGIFEYRVVTQEAERVNLQPIRVSTGMPELQRVPVRPGVSGARADLALGSRVLVGFVDATPARPFVFAFEDADGDGFVPLTLELDAVASISLGAGAVLGAARMTDPVVAGPFGGTVTGGSMKTRIA
jgi:hypothetical protein